MNERRPTRDDVARRAGVSAATVSYVVNNGPRPVATETRQRILQAIKELGYQPNAIAQSLRRQRTFVFGLVVPDSSNPYFADLADKIEVASFAAGYNVILCNARQSEDRELAYARVLAERQVDGVIFIACGVNLHAPRYLVGRGVPIVLIDRQLPNTGATSMMVDGYAAGKMAVQHLLAQGYRTIACIAGPEHSRTNNLRLAGCRAALEEAGLQLPDTLLHYGDYGYRSGFDHALTLLKQAPRPIGLFCCNDRMAIGAIRAAKVLGFHVPHDVGIVGFDDIPEAEYVDPALSTIRQPRNEVAEKAVELLVGLASGQGEQSDTTYWMKPTMVVRDSSTRLVPDSTTLSS